MTSMIEFSVNSDSITRLVEVIGKAKEDIARAKMAQLGDPDVPINPGQRDSVINGVIAAREQEIGRVILQELGIVPK